jgi:FG-GAP repeat
VAAIGDFDSDGKTDLIWRNAQTGDNALWTMNGTLLKTPTLIQKFDDLNWSIA